MGTKYYHALNCNRKFECGVEFQPYSSLGGTWWGIFATEDPAQQNYLDSLVANQRTAVTVISEDDFNKALAQAPGAAGQYNPIPQAYKAPKLPTPAQPGMRIAAKAGVVDENPEPPDPTPAVSSAPLANVAEALVTDKVDTGDAAATTATPAAKPKKPKAETPK